MYMRMRVSVGSIDTHSRVIVTVSIIMTMNTANNPMSCIVIIFVVFIADVGIVINDIIIIIMLLLNCCYRSIMLKNCNESECCDIIGFVS